MFHYWDTQRIDIETQYKKYNVRVFDISLGIDANKHFVFKYHGVSYITFSVYEVLNYLDRQKDCYVRLNLDDNGKYTIEERKEIEKKFQEQCQIFETIYNKIKFFGGLRRSDWTRVYTFKDESKKPIVIFANTDKYSFFKPDTFWQKCLMFFSKRLHAKLRNKAMKEQLSSFGNSVCLFLDHVEI